jgi:hypothetical protein
MFCILLCLSISSCCLHTQTGNVIGAEGQFTITQMNKFENPTLLIDIARNDMNPILTPFPSKPLNSGIPRD